MLDLNKYSDSEISELIEKRVEFLEENSIKTKEIGNVEFSNPDASHHKGFISKDTKVCYSLSAGYYIKTTDYIKEFVEYIRKNKLNCTPKEIFKFVNSYFGENKSNEDYRNERDFKEISDFKGKNIAVCTEKAAISNNLLSFLGMETWFCDGSVYNSNNLCDDHTFVIVKTQNNNYMLYDSAYSIFYNEENHPFITKINPKSAERVLNSNSRYPSKDNCIKLQEYYAKDNDGKTEILNANSYRVYGIGIESKQLKEVVEETYSR